MFIINKIQKWMDTIAGQTFMQYAYSWGAAIVILGTLFKLTHLPGANIMLFVGMGTEVFVFILSGFERVTEKSEESATEGIAQQPVYVSGAPVVMGGSPVVGGVAPVAPVVPVAPVAPVAPAPVPVFFQIFSSSSRSIPPFMIMWMCGLFPLYPAAGISSPPIAYMYFRSSSPFLQKAAKNR